MKSRRNKGFLVFFRDFCKKRLSLLRAAPAKEVEEAGEKTPIFPAGKVAIWIAQQDKFMAALRWFLPRENKEFESLFAKQKF